VTRGRTRRLVGVATLLALAVIAAGVTGFELPRVGGSADRAPLPGVRAVNADLLLRVGATAPAGGELAFLTIEPSGNLLVSDALRRSVMRFDASGHLLAEWGPRLGNQTLAEPAGVAVYGDDIYVLDRGAPRIVRLNSAGQLQATFDLQSLNTYGLNGLAVDLAGNVYAADTGRNRILVFAPSGAVLRQVGRGGNDLGAFTQPMALAFGPDGTFFVADWENARVESWSGTFQPLTAWSTGFRPFGVAVDQIGRVFVPDSDRRRVEAYSPTGATLGEIGASAPLSVIPKQVAIAAGQTSLYVLGGDGIERLDLVNTPPPPQGGAEVDVASLVLIALMLGLVGLAVWSRRQRRARALLDAAPDGPVGLQAVNGAERQDQQAGRDQNLLVAHQTEREQ
jgi:DNA-binding beta-propeller fold protein YncE